MPVVTYSLSTFTGEIIVNENFTGEQFNPDILVRSDGTVDVIWTTHEANAAYSDVVRRRFASNGADLSDEFIINGSGGIDDNERHGRIIQTANGNIVHVQEDNGGGDFEVEHTVYAAGGSVLVNGEAIAPNEGQDDDQRDPELAALTGGGYVVVFEDQFQGISTNININVAIYNNNGVQIGSTLVAAGGNTENPTGSASVAGLSDGRFVVTWREDVDDTPTTNFNIRARIYNANGSVSVGTFNVNTESDVQNEPVVLALPGGGFAIAFTDQQAGDPADVRVSLHVYDANANLMLADISVSQPDTIASGIEIVQVSDNVFAVMWQASLGGLPDGIYGQFYALDGTTLGPIQTIETGVGNNRDVTAARVPGVDAGGRFMTAWVDEGGPQFDTAIRLQGQQLTRTTVGDGAAETLSGDDLADVIDAAGGHDSVSAGAGDDVVHASAGHDTLAGGSGLDTLSFVAAAGGIAVNLGAAGPQNFGSLGIDTISGFERVIGGDFADTITGTANADTLTGGDGNDVLVTHAGDDLLFGGTGNDVLRASAGADTFDGGADVDVIDYRLASSVRVFLDGSGTNAAAAGGDVFIGIENIWGAVGNDVIVGDAGTNRFAGFDGDDTLWGRAGTDQLEGGAGHDRLIGGADNDVLLGGEGADTFVFDQTLAAGGLDRTTDFNVADDQIEIDASVFGGGLVAGGAVQFVAGAAPSAAGFAGGVFLYNTTNGFLGFDADGEGAGAVVYFFRLQNLPALTAADFTVVA